MMVSTIKNIYKASIKSYEIVRNYKKKWTLLPAFQAKRKVEDLKLIESIHINVRVWHLAYLWQGMINGHDLRNS